MNARRSLAGAGALLLLSIGMVGAAGPASAAHVTCGSTITVNTVLDSNVGPCARGVTIGADNITFDLNGFTISGIPATGDGPGIGMTNRSGVTVRNGTVTQFDAGVAITGGSRNTVTQMQILNNRGSFATDFGDGIALFNSHNNAITDNQVRGNGPYSGIGLIRSTGNLIHLNQITDNNQNNNSTAGIRLENLSGGFSSSDNTVTDNLVTGSATFGIQVFAGGSRNLIKNNQVVGNRLDGIVVFAGGSNNTIEENVVRSNGGAGISIRSAAGNFPAPANNRILRNQSFGNTTFDLQDNTANCGTNTWSGNQGFTANQPCTRNP